MQLCAAHCPPQEAKPGRTHDTRQHHTDVHRPVVPLLLELHLALQDGVTRLIGAATVPRQRKGMRR